MPPFTRTKKNNGGDEYRQAAEARVRRGVVCRRAETNQWQPLSPIFRKQCVSTALLLIHHMKPLFLIMKKLFIH